MLRRASFEIGLESILYLFLAFAFNGKASVSTYQMFGCDFVNKEFKIVRNSTTEFTTPIWSNVAMTEMSEVPLDPKDPYWQSIKLYLSQGSQYNNVFQVARFIRNYKSWYSDRENIETFFKNYDIRFEPEYGTLHFDLDAKDDITQESYIIMMFYRLKKQHNSVPQYHYMVSASVDPTDQDISEALAVKDGDIEYQNKVKIVQTRYQDHVAGIMRINTNNRTGYILVDPGYANGDKLVQPFAVFLMDDGKYPHKEYMGESRNIEFNNKKGPFVLAKHTDLNIKVLYHIGKPYCSFMESTAKPNLLRLNQGIVTRSNGTNRPKKIGYLTFKISPEEKAFHLRTMTTITTGVIREDKQILFAENTLNTLKKSSPPPVHPDIEKMLGTQWTDSWSITQDLKYIQNEVFGDTDFMSKLIELRKKLGLN